MQHPYPFASQRASIGCIAALFVVAVPFRMEAQIVVVPQSVIASVDPFSAGLSMADNLTLDITAATTAGTTFPYSPNSGFNEGIGFVSAYGVDVGVITYTFANPVSISRMLVWNAYFDFELDHSMRNVVLTFRNAANAVIATNNITLPMATASDLEGYVANLPTEVLGVKKVEIDVQTLWGGNELSIRRIAFAGNGLNVGLDEEDSMPLHVAMFPNPTVDQSTMLVEGIRTLTIQDQLGRSVNVRTDILQDRVVFHWSGVASGSYFVQAGTDRGRVVARVVVE